MKKLIATMALGLSMLIASPAFAYEIQRGDTMSEIAVDPRVIPLGSKVYVAGYGYAIAGDTGGAIKGNRIDILMPNRSKALDFGRRTIKIKVYK